MIDTAIVERELLKIGICGNQPRTREISCPNFIKLAEIMMSRNIDIQCTLHNAGNDSYIALFALQVLLEPEISNIVSTI